VSAEQFPTCSTCGERNVEDAGDHADRTGHWPSTTPFGGARIAAEVRRRYFALVLAPVDSKIDAMILDALDMQREQLRSAHLADIDAVLAEIVESEQANDLEPVLDARDAASNLLHRIRHALTEGTTP
jgi:hypothetical protein